MTLAQGRIVRVGRRPDADMLGWSGLGDLDVDGRTVKIGGWEFDCVNGPSAHLSVNRNFLEIAGYSIGELRAIWTASQAGSK